MKKFKSLGSMVCCVCLLVGLLSGCNQNTTSSGDAISSSDVISPNSVLSTEEAKNDQTVEKITSYIQTKYFSDGMIYDGNGVDISADVTWNDYLSGFEDRYPCAAVYLTIGDTKTDFDVYIGETTFYYATIDKVLYGDIKQGDTILVMQPGRIQENGEHGGYFPFGEPYQKGQQMMMVLLKGSWYDGKIEFYWTSAGFEGFMETIDDEKYLVFTYDYIETYITTAGSLGEELSDRGLIQREHDFMRIAVKAEIKIESQIIDKIVPVVKQDVFEQFVGTFDEYSARKWYKKIAWQN